MADGSPKTRRELSVLQLLPNLLTVGAICAGLTAIRFAVQGRIELAVALIVLAAALDGLDGRLARLLKSDSAIGAELDSLADFLNFGVAPVLVLYLWGFREAPSAGWIAVLIFAICCVLRLARFNVGSRAEEGPRESSHFIGVPSPAGGLLVLFPLFVAKLAPDLPRLPAPALGGWIVAVGLLMIARFRTPSLKAARIYAENARFALVGVVALVAALLTYPWGTLVAVDVAYLGALAWTCLAARRNGAGE